MIVLSIIIIYIITIVFHLAEAKFDSRKSDTTHWDSMLTQYIVTTWLAWVFPIPFYFGALIATSVRVFFDYMYNHYENNPLNYFGEYSKTDKFFSKEHSIKIGKKEFKFKIPKWVLASGRIVISLSCIATMVYILNR